MHLCMPKIEWKGVYIKERNAGHVSRMIKIIALTQARRRPSGPASRQLSIWLVWHHGRRWNTWCTRWRSRLRSIFRWMPRYHLRPTLQRYMSHPLSGVGSNRLMCIVMVYTDQPSSCYHRFWNIRALWRAPSRTAWRTTFAENPVDRKRLLAALLRMHHRHGRLFWMRNDRRRTTGLGIHANLDCYDMHACLAGLLTK